MVKNLGIFVKHMGQNPVSEEAFSTLNESAKLPGVDDRCLFFKNVGPKPINSNFAAFDSTDIWYFNGVLLVTFLDGLKFVNNITSSNDVYFFYSPETDYKNLFMLIQSTKNVNVISNEAYAQDFYRKTGKKVLFVCEGLTDSVSVIMGEKSNG